MSLPSKEELISAAIALAFTSMIVGLISEIIGMFQ